MVLGNTFTRGEFAGHTPSFQLRQAVQQQQVLASRTKSQADFSGRVTMRLNIHKVSIQRRMRQLPRGGFCIPRAVTQAYTSSREELYEEALQHTRIQQYDRARRSFQNCVAVWPDFCRAWVSYAQMEKKFSREDCRQVLQLGLKLNPRSDCLLQAWGLLELQEGNGLQAYGLLESSVRCGANANVLKWKIVKCVSDIRRTGTPYGGQRASERYSATFDRQQTSTSRIATTIIRTTAANTSYL
mmetsp:Transcript_35129/g.59125  ORF Transcript_35129/g.59125 Transcript_35129/m.59125 type:complete len:242 (+) Transcript_35129:3-728(+)